MAIDISFNASWYLQQNPDVAEAVRAGLVDAETHFQLYGRAEGRSGSPLFDPQGYLSANPDVAAAVAAGQTTALEHFERFGAAEGRTPTPLLDPTFYLQQNPDVAAAVASGAVSSAVEHFVLHGYSEGWAISPSLDLGAYLNANPDVAQAVTSGAGSPLEHLLQHGIAEGRSLGNGVSLSVFASDPAFTQALASGNVTAALTRVESVAPFLPTFERPAGWTPPASTPIPVDFVPVPGSALLLEVPPEVTVPESLELPEVFKPTPTPTPTPTPAPPPLEPDPVPSDTTPPTVSTMVITSATGVQNSTLNAGDVVRVTVTMSEATTVTGTPQLALKIGSDTVQASYVSGSGTTALVFSYTIQTNQTDANGISISANSLGLNGGTLKDAAGNNATLSHALVADNASYMVDAVAPIASTAVTSTVQLEAINVANGNDYSPQITAVGGSGEYVVTWFGEDSSSPTDNSIFVQKFNADGSTTGQTPVQLEATGNSTKSDQGPQITAVGSSGAFVVTWYGEDSASDFSIFVQKFNANGSTAGTPVQLDAIGVTTGFDGSPQITAVGSSGEYVVTWYGEDSSTPNPDYSIFVQKFNADGSTAGTPVQLEAIGVTNGYDGTPQITAVGNSGEFVVTWFGEDSSSPPDNSIFVQKFNANGTITNQTPVQLEAIGKTYGADRSPQITAVGSSGEFVVTWEGIDSVGDSSIFVQKFNANGTITNQTPVQLEAIGKTDGDDSAPQITAVGSSGQFVVTWMGVDSARDYSIFVQKFNADGSTTNQTPVQLEATGNSTKSDQRPQITAVGSSGEFVVTWMGVDSAGDNSIFVQKFNADGSTTNQTPVQLEAIGKTNGVDSFPQITAVGSSGEFVVTWYGEESAGDFSIFVQKFNASGQPVPSTALINNTGTVPVRSTEAGTAYLVKSTVAVTALADITGAADAQWNQVAITIANTDTALAVTGLDDGSYRLYTVDAAGNLSVSVAGAVFIDSTAPTASAFTATATTVGATSTEAGTLGLYDGANLIGSTAAFTAPDGLTQTLTVSARTTATSATLKVSDAAGNVATGTQNVVLGTAGNDTALGGTGNADFIYGFDGEDTITGGDGADTITGGAGADVLDGGAGNDTFIYASMADFAVASSVDGGAVIDSIAGGDGTADKIQVNAAIEIGYNDNLSRVTAVEQLVAETQSSFARGHTVRINSFVNLGSIGTIDLSGDTSADSTAFIDLIDFANPMALKGVGVGQNRIFGGPGNDSIDGGVGNDALAGMDGVNVMNGHAGNDEFIYSSIGQLFTGNKLVDSITGGDGTDTIRLYTYGFTIAAEDSFARASSVEVLASIMLDGDTSITLNADAFTTAGIRTVTLAADTDAQGNNTIDASNQSSAAIGLTLTGSKGVDSITGGAGNDTITGGAGNDVMDGGAGDDVIMIDLSLSGSKTINGGDGSADTVLLSGNLMTFSVLDDAALVGVEIVSSVGSAGPGWVDINLSNQTEAFQILSGDGTTPTGRNFLQGGSADDTIVGGSKADKLQGNGGADVLDGKAGDDLFTYTSLADLFSNSALIDSITGGDGTDTIRVEDAAGFTIAAADSFARANTVEALAVRYAASNPISITLNADAFTAGIRTVTLAEDWDEFGNNTIDASNQSNAAIGLTLTGSDGVDSIKGGAGVDGITGGAGADVLDGGAGNDTFIYASSSEFLRGAAGSRTVEDSVTGSADTDTIQISGAIDIAAGDSLARVNTVERLVAATASGAALAHSVVLNSNTAIASIRTIDLSGETNPGSTGVINLKGVTSTLTGTTLKGVSGGGSNTITGGSGVDSITGGSGDDTITGGGGSDVLNGGDGNDVFVFSSDSEFGYTSLFDTITGGAGTDTLRISSNRFTIGSSFAFGKSSGVEILAAGVAATGELKISLNSTALTAGIRTVTLAADTNPTGLNSINATDADSTQHMTLIGSAGVDSITGGAGADSITGGSGGDNLAGGYGADTIALGSADSAIDTVTYIASGETDNRTTGFFTGGSTSAMDVITEAAIGDKLKVWDGFLAGGTTVATSYLTDATTNKVAIVQGALDANGSFTAGTGGSNDDYIVQWADGTNVHSVVLKDYGTTAPTLTADATADTLTLAVPPDITPPTVTSVTAPADKTYKLDDTLSFTVNTSENVTVTGTPQLALTIGSTTVQADYASGSGTNALVFSYTVASTDLDTDGIAVGTLGLNGGTLKDAAGNDMTLTLNGVGVTTGVKVDGEIPTVTTTSAAYTEASDTLTITGAHFDTLLESGENADTDIKARLDWSKLVWDINGDDANTANVSFAEGDISSAKVTNATTLTLVLTSTKGTALEGTTGYGATGNADTLDIAAGFAKDAAGNAATTDALANGVLTITAPDTTPPTATAFTVTATTVGATSNEAGTLGLYDGSTLIGSTAAFTAQDGLTQTLTMSAQTTRTSATLKVSDTAGNVATATQSVILGSNDGESIYGGIGADIIFGFEVFDMIYGDAGDDTIIGGAGADMLQGEAGNDTFIYASSAEFLTGNAGSRTVEDSVTGGDGTDTIQISGAIAIAAGDSLARVNTVERLVAATASNVGLNESIVLNSDSAIASIRTIDLSGETHYDSTGVIDLTGVTSAVTGTTLKGVNGGNSNTITGGAGVDSITGGAGADTLNGGAGADVITGGDGADTIDLGALDAAADTVVYTMSGDTLVGVFTNGGSTAGMDVITSAAPGDKLKLWYAFSGAVTVGTVFLTTTAANQAAIVRGSWSGTAFMQGSAVTDDDYIVQWADGTNVHSVVLKDYGTTAPTLTADAAADTLTLATAVPPLDPSVVVFDFVNGVSSSHSSRTFDPNVSYTIYVRVDSNSSTLNTTPQAAAASGASWGTWSNPSVLGADDTIILVGTGTPLLGEDGGEVTGFEAIQGTDGYSSPMSSPWVRIGGPRPKIILPFK